MGVDAGSVVGRIHAGLDATAAAKLSEWRRSRSREMLEQAAARWLKEGRLTDRRGRKAESIDQAFIIRIAGHPNVTPALVAIAIQRADEKNTTGSLGYVCNALGARNGGNPLKPYVFDQPLLEHWARLEAAQVDAARAKAAVSDVLAKVSTARPSIGGGRGDTKRIGVCRASRCAGRTEEKRSMMMAKAQEFVLPTQAAWNAICRLRIARENVKSWLTNAEEELKDARREIDELGVRGEDSKEFSDAAARKERAERQRDALKERLKTLANKIDTAVEDAAKGNEKLFDDIDWKSLESKPTAKELYHAEDDESQMEIGQGEKKVKPIGRPGPVKPEHPAAEMGDGYAEHLKVSVLELDLPEKLKGKLQRDGFETVGSVIAAIDKEGYTNPKTTRSASCSTRHPRTLRPSSRRRGRSRKSTSRPSSTRSARKRTGRVRAVSVGLTQAA